jgi:hypothetical protein
MLFLFDRNFVVCGAVSAAVLLSAERAWCAPGYVSETWDSYTNNAAPFGDWKVDAARHCEWGEILSDKGPEHGKCYWVKAETKSRIVHDIDLSASKDIVLQGWLYDSGIADSKGGIGFVDAADRVGNNLIRIGLIGGTHRAYVVVYYDPLQAKSSLTINTGMPVEKGWHFMRLDIHEDRSVTYRVWNADQTIENKGNFVWVFDKKKLTQVTIGAVPPTTGPLGFANIKVGDLEQVGPPPSLLGEPKTARTE